MAVLTKPSKTTPKSTSVTAARRREPRTLVTRFVGYAVLIFFSLVFLYPFVIQIGNSFKTEPDAAANPLSPVPDPIDLSSFQRIFEGTNFPLWLGNSLLVTVLVTLGRVFFDSLAGYALARLRFAGRGAVFAAVIAVMAVPGVVLLIPKFLVLNQLGIYNSYSALIVPLLADAAGVFIMKQFFESIPVSVEEAARIDGAGTFRTFWSVVLPMAKPALITLTILSFQGSWNEFPHSLVALPGRGPGLESVHPAAWFGRPGQRLAGQGHAVSAQARRRAAGHHPGRGDLHGLPAVFRARCQRRRGQELTVRSGPDAALRAASGPGGQAD